MTTIAEKLTRLTQAKTALKQALVSKGIDVATTTFEDLHTKITPNITPSVNPWVRPADWLTLPAVASSDKKFVGLHAIYPSGNYVALSATGAYTVDWGDGVVENYAANAVAEHQYNYTTYDTSNTTRTTQDYKQAIVTVTPQGVQDLTALNLHHRHSATTAQYTSGFLDIAVAGPQLSDLRVSVADVATGARLINFGVLEQINIVNCKVQSFKNMFSKCSNLKSIVGITTTATTVTMDSMFMECTSLAEVPLFDTTAVTNMLSMFQSCKRLHKVPLFNTESVTTMGAMFYECFCLPTVPLFNTSNVTDMTNMFGHCSALKTVPQFDTRKVLDFYGMFTYCYALIETPIFDMTAATSVGEMFRYCLALGEVHLTNMDNVTNLLDVFNNCDNLSKITMGGLKQSVDISFCKLNAAALNSIYSNLDPVVNKIIDVTDNYGTLSDNPAIATAKGWTVSGT